MWSPWASGLDLHSEVVRINESDTKKELHILEYEYVMASRAEMFFKHQIDMAMIVPMHHFQYLELCGHHYMANLKRIALYNKIRAICL